MVVLHPSYNAYEYNSLGLRIYVPRSQTHLELIRTKSTLILRILPFLTFQPCRRKETLYGFLSPQTTHASQARRWFWHARSSHCYFDAIYFPKHSLSLHYRFYLPNTFFNCPGQPATAPSFFSIISYQSFCHLSKIRDFPGTLLLKILTSPTTIWMLLSCMQFHGLIFP